MAPKYPVGANRVRLAIESLAERLGAAEGSLADLGCGGGDLCVEVARLGMAPTGVDIAEGMIEQAGRAAQSLEPDVRGRLRFVLADVLASGLPDASFDAVTALGLIEYLPEDGPLLREAHRLLRPGGVLVVSCRNRLFNLASLNEFTAREVEAGGALPLLEEITDLGRHGLSADALADFAGRLGDLAPALREALEEDRRTPAEGAGPRPSFGQERRQHSPEELASSARAAGFAGPGFVGVHPHPLPPAAEPLAPRFYNQLARAFEALEREPLAMTWSSAFLGVFTRPEG
ncbi:MAG: methyltransferase domain-containing protein [Actinomycetota bacterium]|nr:methyltransferase domain-containing protein [Actinomycetota bacterium]